MKLKQKYKNNNTLKKIQLGLRVYFNSQNLRNFILIHIESSGY